MEGKREGEREKKNRGKRNIGKKQKANIKMENLSPKISIIIFNVNGLNIPIKRETLTE